MATTSSTILRRLAGCAFTLLLGLCLSPQLMGQGTPLVTVSSAAGLSHPTGWGAIQQSAIDSNGDWVVVDYANGAVYEFPAGGGAAITLVPAAGLGGGYENPAVAIDPGNNLYLGANWNNAMVMFPWNPAATAPGTGQWTGLGQVTATNATTAICPNNGKNLGPNCWAQYGIGGYSQGYFQPWGISIGINGTMVIGNQNSNNFIMVLGVNGAWSNPVSSGQVLVEPIGTMTKRPISVAEDPEGDIYFVEDSGGLQGVYEITAAQVAAAADTSASPTGNPLANDCPNSTYTNSTCLTRVDPNLPSVSAIVTDAAGNLYVSDSKEGVFFIPNNAGTIETNSAVLLAPIPAQGEVSIDWARNIMYVPTTQAQNNGQADVAQLRFGYTELGSSPVGTATATSGVVSYGFNGNVTPGSFAIVQDGKQTPEFAITGGTCATGSAYTAGQGCSEQITFTPSAPGSSSATMLMLDANKNVLASIMLHGTGVGANVQVSPAIESTIGGSLVTPNQVAVDTAGNVYVADAGQGKVLMYAAGSSAKPTSIGTGLNLSSPTGVAVDGTGDVFIADSGTGTVYEVPFGPSGLNAAGASTLATGLGTGLNLAADGLGDLYVADPTHGRVVKITDLSSSTSSNLGQSEIMLTTGLTAPSAVAVGPNNNLYVADGAKLFKFTAGTGAPTTLMSTLNGVTGLATDASSAIYIAEAGGTTRIPNVGGTLGAGTAVASDVTSPMAIALDRNGNVYLADGTKLDVDVVSAGTGTVPLATPGSLTGSTNANFTVTNSGNAPLTVTAYTSNNSVDFTAADGTCIGSSPIAPGAACEGVVTFNPGPGQQGSLSAQIGVTSNAINAPSTINVSATGLALSGSTTSGTVGSSAQVINTPLTVNVASAGGSGPVPTGTVTVTYSTWNVQANQIVPVTAKITGTLTNGQAQFSLAPVLAGADSFIISYSGDRVYGTSTKTVTGTVAKSAITGITLPPLPDPTDNNLPYTLSLNAPSATYGNDANASYFEYVFKMKVTTAIGIPTGTIVMNDNSSTCPPGTSATGMGVATCQLQNYSGVACPVSSADGTLQLQNSGANNSAGTSFNAECLYQEPTPTPPYTPVIYTHYITPTYSGDANFIGATGGSRLFQAVDAPSVQITANAYPNSSTTPPAVSVTPGSSVTMNLTLTSILGYGLIGRGSSGTYDVYYLPLTLACDNLPPHATCSFTYPTPDAQSPNAVDIPWPSACTTQEVAEGLADSAGDLCEPSTTPVSTSSGTMTTGTGQVIMTINTNVTTGTTTTSRNAMVTSVTLASIFGFGMIGLFVRRKAFEKGRFLLMVVLMFLAPAVALSITACNTTNLLPGGQLSSPAGSYLVRVTAQQVGNVCVAITGTGSSNCTTTTGLPGNYAWGSNNQSSLPFYVNLTVQ